MWTVCLGGLCSWRVSMLRGEMGWRGFLRGLVFYVLINYGKNSNGMFCAYDLSSRIRGSHCAPGSGIAVCSGIRDACVYAPGVSDGGGGGNGGCPPVMGVPVLLSSALFGFGGGNGGVLASYCCDILCEAYVGRSPDVPWLSDIVRMEKQSSPDLRGPGCYSQTRCCRSMEACCIKVVVTNLGRDPLASYRHPWYILNNELHVSVSFQVVHLRSFPYTVLILISTACLCHRPREQDLLSRYLHPFVFVIDSFRCRRNVNCRQVYRHRLDSKYRGRR